MSEAFVDVLTERLELRRVVPGDLGAVHAIHSDPSTQRHNPTGPITSPAESAAVLERWLAWWRERGLGFWAVRRRGEPAVIGFGGLIHLRFHDRDALNLYYRFTPSAWGRGYASEMATTALALARAHLPGLPVVVRTRPSNAAAQALARRIGLIRRPDLDTDGFVAFVSDAW